MSFYEDFLRISREVVRNNNGNLISPKEYVEPLIGNKGVHQEIGSFYVTSLYPSRGIVGAAISSNPQVFRALGRTASILSDIPTHGIQGARYGAENSAFHVVTRKRPEANNNSIAMHSLATATLHRLMFYPENEILDSNPVAGLGKIIKGSNFGTGLFEGPTAIHDRLKTKTNVPPFANLDEKKMAYFMQYAGTADMYGSFGGFDAWFVNNDPNQISVDASVRRWNPAINTLKEMFNIGANDETLKNRALRSRLGLLSRCTQIYNAGREDSATLDRPGDINDFGFAHDRLEPYLNEASSVVNTRQLRRFLNLIEASYDNTTFTNSVPGATSFSTPQPTATPSSTSTSTTSSRSTRSSSNIIDDAIDNTPTANLPTFTSVSHTPIELGNGNVSADELHALFRASGNDAHGNFNFLDAFASIPNPETSPVVNYVNRNVISVIPDSAFTAIEERYPIGGIETDPDTEGNLSTTNRSVDALQQIRERIDAAVGFDRDADYYKQLGRNHLLRNAFDVVHVNPREVIADADISRRLALGGALIDVDGDGNQKWLVDDIVQDHMYRNARHDVAPRDWRTTDVNTGTMPFPRLAMNPNSWEIVNAPDMQVQQALKNGYIIPIANNKVIFAPSFTAMDFTFGMEFEADNLHQSARHIQETIRRNFGYDINNMGFKGTFRAESELSLPNGTEYVTPIMSGVRAVKAAFMVGEALRMSGATIGGHVNNRRGRNDPSGIHVNVGTVPEHMIPNAIKFSADYLRLTEDVFKKVTSPDMRYRYSSRNEAWFATMPHSLEPNAARNVNAEGRQFWSQSLSNLRRTDSGVGEYDFLRENGRFWANLESMRPSSTSSSSHFSPNSDAQKLAKYKTMAIHKLALAGIMEFRSAMFVPGGNHAVAQLAMASKLASDIYQGASNGTTGNVAVTDKLIPPTNGWNERTRPSFNNILDTVFGISNHVDQSYMWSYYNTCKGVSA